MATAPLKARKQMFVENMRLLVAVTRLNLRELSEQSGLGAAGYRWLRRASRLGIHGATESNRRWLDKLMRFLKQDFRISSVEDFWSEELIPSFIGRLEQNRIAKIRGTGTTNKETKQMLEELLNTNEFEYLRSLVNDLHFLRFKSNRT